MQQVSVPIYIVPGFFMFKFLQVVLLTFDLAFCSEWRQYVQPFLSLDSFSLHSPLIYFWGIFALAVMPTFLSAEPWNQIEIKLKSNWFDTIIKLKLCKSLLYLGEWYEVFNAEYVVMPIWVWGMNFLNCYLEQLSKHDQVMHYIL